MFKDESEFRKVIDRLNIDAEPNQKHRDDLRQQMLNVFNETKQQSQKPATPHGVLRRIIMKSPITKLAAAAIIIIAVLIGMPFFSSDTSNIVLADVLERVEQAQAYMYKIDITSRETSNPEIPMIQKIKSTVIVSKEYGTKVQTQEKRQTETDAGISPPDTYKTSTEIRYILPNRKLDVEIRLEQKKYRRRELNDDSIARMKKQNNDPRELLKRMLECEYNELGRTVLNGVEVEGFETTDPKCSEVTLKNPEDYEDVRVKLWVDAKTRLPVLWETNMTIKKFISLHTVCYDYQWNFPVNSSDFEPVIPGDYTSMTYNKYQWPVREEQEAMKGLKFFAETMRQYPTMVNLKKFRYGDYMLLMREIKALKDRNDLTDAGKKLYEEMEQLTGMERMNKIMTLLQPVQSLGWFYMMLEKDKKWDAAYYGDTVTVQDIEKVLLRWKISDDRYRVIFGDLSILDVSADELAELEKSSIDAGDKMPSLTEEAAPQGTDTSTATDHYNRGDAHYFDGEYNQAFSELTKAIEKDPALDRAYETRGTAYNDKGQYDLAIADFTKVIELKPADAHAYVSRGVAYQNKGEYDLAVADYTKAIEIDPTVAGAYGCRARAYYYKGEYDKAWKDVYKAQALGRKVDSKLLEKLPKASGTVK